MMIAVRAIFMAIGLLWLVFVLGVGYLGYRVQGIESHAVAQADDDSSEPTSAERENERANRRAREREEYDNEVRFQAGKPMIDPDPAHRY